MPFSTLIATTTFVRTLRTPATRTVKMLGAVRGLATVKNTHFSLSSPPPVHRDSVPAALKLKSGQVFQGTSFGAQTSNFGEAVFTTSLVGYPESMTDPSFRGQILVFTQPLIGNYGVPSQVRDEFGLLKYFESDKIHVQGIVVTDYSTHYSHWNAVESLAEWCIRHNVPALSGVDTRAIVHLLREKGSTLAQLAVGDDALDTTPIASFPDPNIRNLVAEVSSTVPTTYNSMGDIKIAVVDCGVKTNILRCLAKRGAAVTVLPWDYDYRPIMDQFDGIFISNGPGDPRKCTDAVDHLRGALASFGKPIFGICMGNLLLGQAAGLDVYKLRFGNRGHNQPAINMLTGRCFITSQNHGYALKDDALPPGWQKYFVNANDSSNEGIFNTELPFKSVQFHPEAKGGPRDTEYLFEDFLNQVRTFKSQKEGVKFFVPQSVQRDAVALNV